MKEDMVEKNMREVPSESPPPESRESYLNRYGTNQLIDSVYGYLATLNQPHLRELSFGQIQDEDEMYIDMRRMIKILYERAAQGQYDRIDLPKESLSATL